ncbi:MAG TPA: DUF559 domain-containing protein [Nitrospirae bacterium]|nr:DUF559 domain-containing protein [Nitrospirota bacterium]
MQLIVYSLTTLILLVKVAFLIVVIQTVRTNFAVSGFKEVFERDKKKEQRLNEIGIRVLRYSDDDVLNNIKGVLDIKDCMNKIKNKHTP